MRYFSIFFILALLISCLLVTQGSAETRYVGDQLIITLRQGKSTKHKILKTLKTGTPIEVLEEDDSYYKVRTNDGVEGYVLRQYVSSNPPKTQRIEELEVLNSSLRKKMKELEIIQNDLQTELNSIQQKYDSEVSEISSQSTEIESRLQQALDNEQIMAEKYDTLLVQAENVVEIAAERDRLLQQNKKLQADTNVLIQQNDQMADSRMIKWFLAGGGVFFFGWIVGKISRKKRSRF